MSLTKPSKPVWVLVTLPTLDPTSSGLLRHDGTGMGVWGFRVGVKTAEKMERVPSEGPFDLPSSVRLKIRTKVTNEPYTGNRSGKGKNLESKSWTCYPETRVTRSLSVQHTKINPKMLKER